MRNDLDILAEQLKEFGLGARNIAVSHIRFPRKNFSGDFLEKAYLIGFRIGDLNISKCGPQSETVAVKCATTKQGQLILFKTLFSKYGHIIEGRPTKEGKINIQASLNPSFCFLFDKTPSSYKWVFKDKNTFFAFLAGFSDAEGSFFVSQNKGVFSIGNYNKPLLIKIREFLKRFSVETAKLGVYYKIQRKAYDGYLSKGDYYILSCHKKTSLLKLINLLKPHIKHPDKVKKMLEVKQNIVERNLKFGNINM